MKLEEWIETYKLQDRFSGDFNEITTLDLHLKGLTHLPTDFNRLEKLETLILEDNNFLSIEEVEGLQSLRELYLNGNVNLSMPDFSKISQLTHLSIRKTQSLEREIINILSALRNLEFLDISLNDIRIYDELVSTLKAYPALNTLIIDKDIIDKFPFLNQWDKREDIAYAFYTICICTRNIGKCV